MCAALLIADEKVPADFMRRCLVGQFTLIRCVHTYDEAVRAVAAQRFALVICGMHFDECRMMDFLLHFKELPDGKETPFLCVQLLDAHPETTNSVAATHAVFGASGFMEFFRMDERSEKRLQDEVARLLQTGSTPVVTDA